MLFFIFAFYSPVYTALIYCHGTATSTNFMQVAQARINWVRVVRRRLVLRWEDFRGSRVTPPALTQRRTEKSA